MSHDVLIGDLVADTQTYSLVQVCMICGVTTDLVVGLVAFGIVVPAGDRPESWRFSEVAVYRAKKAVRLHLDLGLDQQGLALSLDLLDEIDRLRAQVVSLRRNTETAPVSAPDRDGVYTP